MSRTAEALRMQKAYLEGYYATDLSECKYKYGGETWHAWMDGWESGKSECSTDYKSRVLNQLEDYKRQEQA